MFSAGRGASGLFSFRKNALSFLLFTCVFYLISRFLLIIPSSHLLKCVFSFSCLFSFPETGAASVAVVLSSEWPSAVPGERLAPPRRVYIFVAFQKARVFRFDFLFYVRVTSECISWFLSVKIGGIRVTFFAILSVVGL